MIRVYPSVLDGDPIESHTIERRTTIEGWLRTVAPGYERSDNPPLKIKVNGDIIDPCEWSSLIFGARDDVQIYVVPRGGVVNAVLNVFTLGAWTFVQKYFAPKIPNVNQTANTSRRTAQGDGLNAASARGNIVDIGSRQPELAGYQRVYPSFLVPSRRYFAGPRDQRIEMLLCVTRGKCEVAPTKVRLGDTPFISLGSDASYRVYAPGADLSAEPAHMWWHTSPEVGSSSSGSAGLDLTKSVNLTLSTSGASYAYSGNTITGTMPSDWEAGLIVRIVAPYNYTVVDGGGAARDIIRSDFLTMLAPTVGDTIEIAGANAGTYLVNSYNPSSPAEMTLSFPDGSPVAALSPGTQSMSIGPVGLRYRVLSATVSGLQVIRLKTSGAEDPGFPNFATITLGNSVISLDASSVAGGYRGPFTACPENEKVTQIQWDIFAQQGIYGQSAQTGAFRTVRSVHSFEYRDFDVAGPWTAQEFTHTGNSPDAVGFTNTITLPYPMRPECRIKKIIITTSSEWHTDIQWYGLRGLMQNYPTSYAGVTALAVTVRGGDRVSSESESKISLEAIRVLPERRGGAWTPEVATRQIAAWFGYVAHSAGYTDDDIDLVELDRLQEIWDERGDTFDMYLTDNTTVQDALNMCLQVGYAELTIRNDRLTPVRDELRTQYDHIYSMQGATSHLQRKLTFPNQANDYDGCDVKYFSEITWSYETVKCRWPGDAGTNVESVTIEGISTETRAWRWGMRRRGDQLYRKDSYVSSTELAALNSNYYDFVGLSDDVPNYSQSALLTDYTVDGTTVVLEVSDPFIWESGKTYIVYIRKPDGTPSGPWPPTRIDDTHIRVPVIDFVPDVSWAIEPPHVMFGEANRVLYPALVTEVEPGDGSEVEMTAKPYDARVYTYDDQSPV